MANHTSIPAISREVEFIAKNVSEADAIRDGDFPVAQGIKEITEAVYTRADDHVEALLLVLEQEVELAVNGVFRVKWVNSANRRRKWWSNYGDIRNARGRMKHVGWVGLCLWCDDAAPRLFGWADFPGGLDGRKRLARTCDGKIETVKVASEHPRDYPGWAGNDDVLFWFDQKLTLATGRHELREGLGRCAKRFFKVVKRAL